MAGQTSTAAAAVVVAVAVLARSEVMDQPQ